MRIALLVLIVACSHDHDPVSADAGALAADASGPDGAGCAQACESPPAPACVDAMMLATAAATGTCDHGTCSYAITLSSCAFGCTAGACTPDPCATTTCDAPPPATCSSNAMLASYGAGTCTAGACHYATTIQPCDAGCYGDACIGPASDACGVCDRDWQCDAGLDHWSSLYDSDGFGCRDDRTGTTLRCDGSLDNDPDDSWVTTSWGMELLFGGVLGEHEVDCDPAP